MIEPLPAMTTSFRLVIVKFLELFLIVIAKFANKLRLSQL